MTMLNALTATDRIAQGYRGYLRSTFRPRDKGRRDAFDDALNRAFRLTKGPYLQASAPFELGASLAELIDEELLAPDMARLGQGAFPIDRPLYLHQEQAIRKAAAHHRNLVVATGTGSGKTECFLVPILDHLLRELRDGTLSQPGVRALLLYPMNALANDQVKRLRRLLTALPEVTFGRYVGETAEGLARAEADFRERYPSEPRLPNELLAREQMREQPPHILLTNFAMLEYLLLRPDDSSLFDGPTGGSWRFVVLDEAHVYDGAQGTEIAMLLRRLRDRVLGSERGRLACFATSATLGRGAQDHPTLVEFATALFDEPFAWDDGDPDQQDIITATRQPLVRASAGHQLPQPLFRQLQAAFRDGAGTGRLRELTSAACSGLPLPGPDLQPAAFLLELLNREATVVALQELLDQRSVDLHEAAAKLFGPGGEQDLVALIDLCVAARAHPQDAPLIPARYHFFLRALEGAFVCLHPQHQAGEPTLRLARHSRCPSCAARGRPAVMFELGVCRSCGAEYLVGERVDGDDGGQALRPTAKPGARLTYLFLDKPGTEDEDERVVGDHELPNLVAWRLCPGCGALAEGDQRLFCTCPERPQAVPVMVIAPRGDDDVLHTCATCSSRTPGDVVTRFLTGMDAPVAVVATDLYQQLPPSSDTGQARWIGSGRKLLTFADSRQDAAFFAPYLERTYRRAVQRRLLADAIASFGDDERPRLETLARTIRSRAEDCLILDPDRGSVDNLTEARSWLVEELLAIDHRQSLEGTGTAEIAIAVPRAFDPPAPLLALGLTPEEVETLLCMLLSTIRGNAAVTMPEHVDIRDERFAPRNREVGVRERGPERGVLSWMPGSGSNRRLGVLTKVLERKRVEADPKELLADIWRYLSHADGPWASVLVSRPSPKGPLWRLAHDRLEFVALGDRHRPLRCTTCQRLWWRTVADVCPTWQCQGTLHEVKNLDELLDNHYARLYRRLEPVGMAVQEHTAQWVSTKASSIQDEFVRGKLNVLSCSTTFELGVDVGEVQTVLLRNVPPRPANYVQRAGRAGRRTDTAALAVTFAQRRSHDLTHFNDPRPMVDGTVTPPVILLDNPSIVRRHVHSVAFAMFERRVAARGSAHRNVEDFFATPGDGAQPADRQFLEWLGARPAALGAALQRIVPTVVAARLGIDDWSWVNALVEPSDLHPTHGWLTRAGDHAREELGTLDQLREQAAAATRYKDAERYKRVRNTLAGRQLIGFLASRNVLPKYGFPVDVVELDLTRSGDADAANLDLARDLQLAISEFAPGGQVVAAKAVWVSQGLAKRSDRDWPQYQWGVCGDCGAYRQGLAGRRPQSCDICGATRVAPGKAGTYLIPVFGLVGKRHTAPGESRPPRMATTETFFGAYETTAPPLEPVPGLHMVQRRSSRQGRIILVNRGPKGNGFLLCDWCGHGEPCPQTGRRAPRRTTTHDDLRRPGRPCTGTLRAVHLGHEFLTDVTEVRFDVPMTDQAARSALYGLLEGAAALAIARDDIDGTLYRHTRSGPPALVVYDTVPGGAGHAQRIAERLDVALRAALVRVTECDCGEETSCYGCLRSYGNQLWHDELSRGAARAVLSSAVHERAQPRPSEVAERD